MIKAVIPAGGEGSRLRPLTCDLPKPMMRLCGRPVLEYILDLLCRHGFTHAALTLGYLPNRIIEHFPNGSYCGMTLDFVTEPYPLGTAGSVRLACDACDEEILVISGDALCDFNLTKAIALHRSRHADATILVKQVDDPREYGLIICDEAGRITAFLEKPSYTQAISDLANTGIYILSRRALEMIPTDHPYDFAQDLFPAMLQQGMLLLCCRDDGYWCDIGDLHTYRQCQRDLLDGKVDCTIHAKQDADGNRFADAIPQGSYTIFPPVYIGQNVIIGDSCVIEAGSIIDDGCFLAPNARVRSSVILPGAYIGQGARLTGALAAAGSRIKANAMLFEGCVVGAGAVIGERTTVSAEVKIWNGKTVPDGIQLSDHVKIGQARQCLFDDRGISGQVGLELTPEFCARLGVALGSLYANARIGLGYDTHRSSAVLASALAAGIRSADSDVLDFGETFPAQFAFSVGFTSLPAGIFLCGGDQACLHLMGAGGLPADRPLERRLESILSRSEFARCRGEQMGDLVPIDGMDKLYRSRLVRCAPAGLDGLTATVRSPSSAVRETLQAVLRQLGCEEDDTLTLELPAEGDRVSIHTADHGDIPAHKIFSVCASKWMGQGNPAAVPFSAPRVLDEIAKQAGQKLLRYALCPADDSDDKARAMAASQLWPQDGLLQSVMFLHFLRETGDLPTLMRCLPQYQMASRTLTIKGSIPALMRKLSGEQNGRITEGVLLHHNGGAALIRPAKSGTRIHILAESYSSETASELCDFAESLLGGKKTE